MSRRGDLYNKLHETYKKRYPGKDPGICQNLATQWWNSLKSQRRDPQQFEAEVNDHIQNLILDAAKEKSSRKNYWIQV